MLFFCIGSEVSLVKLVVVTSDKKDESSRFLFPVEFGEYLRKQPEAKLWAYCLTQGIATALGAYRTAELSKWGSRDRFWLLRDRRHYVGSCSWICELLGIDRRRLILHVIKNRHTLRKNPYQLRIQYNDC